MHKSIFFDFDCTITFTHYYLFMNKPKVFVSRFGLNRWMNTIISDYELIKKSIYNSSTTYYDLIIDVFFGGAERFNTLKQFFDTIQKMDVDMYISSNGYCADIVSLLKLVGMDKYFVEIHSREAYDSEKCVDNNFDEKQPSKDKIRYLFDKLEIYDEIYFIDDDETIKAGCEIHGSNLIIKNSDNKIKYFGSNIGLFNNKNGLDGLMMNFIIQQLNNNL